MRLKGRVGRKSLGRLSARQASALQAQMRLSGQEQPPLLVFQEACQRIRWRALAISPGRCRRVRAAGAMRLPARAIRALRAPTGVTGPAADWIPFEPIRLPSGRMAGAPPLPGSGAASARPDQDPGPMAHAPARVAAAGRAPEGPSRGAARDSRCSAAVTGSAAAVTESAPGIVRASLAICSAWGTPTAGSGAAPTPNACVQCRVPYYCLVL